MDLDLHYEESTAAALDNMEVVSDTDSVMDQDAMEDNSTLYGLPNEMWLSIFETMEDPADLYRVILSNRRFYDLAIRLLYRKMRWNGPFQFFRSTPIFDRLSAMTEVPISLTVSVSTLTSNSFGRFDPGAAIVDPDGSWRIAPQSVNHIPNFGFRSENKRLAFFASPDMYRSMTRRIATFKNLRELIFHSAELPGSIFPAIKALPRLDRLAIQYCTLPPMYQEPDRSFADLPITELTLWANKGDSDSVPLSNYVYVLFLCTATNLRVLRIDWNSVTARFLSLSNSVVTAAGPITLPANLVEVMLRFPQAKLWPSEDDEARSNVANPLSRFLGSSPGIRTFSVVNRRTPFDLPISVMPDLQSYSGPTSTLASVLANRPVYHLDITDVDKRANDVLRTLGIVGGLRSGLQTLSFLTREWDDEIMYALVTLFTDLREIEIKYNTNPPAEQTLISLGAQFLWKFPNLRSFRLYLVPPIPPNPAEAGAGGAGGGGGGHTPELINLALSHALAPRANAKIRYDPTVRGPGAASDEEVKELIVPWRRHCPYLREVQFVDNYVWRRAYDGDKWCKRKLVKVDRMRDLN